MIIKMIIAFVCLLSLLLSASVNAFPTKDNFFRTTGKNIQRLPKRNLQLKMIPQIVFVSACAGGVFLYVLNNIDEIKAKQAVVIGKY